MRVLFHHYHPVIEDLCNSFSNHLKFEIDCAVNISISDHYGDHKDLLKRNQAKYTNFKSITLQQALVKLKVKSYSLVIVDGVYDGDKDIIQICKDKNIPYVCVSGYPYLRDEDSKNILSFSWFMPQVQYLNQFPSEGHVKELSLDAQRKNIFVFYPEFSHAKRYAKENPRLLSSAYKNGYVSFIHRFEECNKKQYEHYLNIKNLCYMATFRDIENYSNLSQEEVLFKMNNARGMVHTKMFDCPGIALIEAQLLGCVPFVYEQFILGSFDQDVMIDSWSCVVSNSDKEFVDNLKSDKWANLSQTTQQHAMMITDFKRQQDKLEKFIQRCLK